MGSYPKHKKTIKSRTVERVSEDSSPWYAGRLLQEHKTRYIFAGKSVKNKVILDIACGNGYGTAILAQYGAKFVYGIDYDKAVIDHANTLYRKENIRFILGNAMKIPLNDKSIDVVVSFETIEHLIAPQRFLKEANRILKPGGILMLSTPNREISYEDNPYHLKEYTFQELNSLLLGFSEIIFYGQRPVFKHIVRLYKFIYKNISKIPVISPLKFFLRFRPWENQKIFKIKNLSEEWYMYFIVVCRRSR